MSRLISMEFNRDYTGDRYRAIAKAMGVEGTETMTQEEYRDAAIAAVRQLSKDVGIPEKNERIRKKIWSNGKRCSADAHIRATPEGQRRNR